MRKPVRIVTGTTQGTGTEIGHMIYALCDDGSMWSDGGSMWFTDGRQWGRLPDIPQDEPDPKPATNFEIVLVLRELAKAEKEFRSTYQEKEIFGAKLSLKWNLLRVAGDAARAVLKRIDEQEVQR